MQEAITETESLRRRLLKEVMELERKRDVLLEEIKTLKGDLQEIQHKRLPEMFDYRQKAEKKIKDLDESLKMDFETIKKNIEQNRNKLTSLQMKRQEIGQALEAEVKDLNAKRKRLLEQNASYVSDLDKRAIALKSKENEVDEAQVEVAKEKARLDTENKSLKDRESSLFSETRKQDKESKDKIDTANVYLQRAKLMSGTLELVLSKKAKELAKAKLEKLKQKNLTKRISILLKEVERRNDAIERDKEQVAQERERQNKEQQHIYSQHQQLQEAIKYAEKRGIKYGR